MIGVGLFTLEALTPGFFFATALALGSFVAAGATFLNYGLEAEALIALISSILIFILLRTVIARYHFSRNNRSKIMTNVEALIGKNGVIVEPIAFPQPGRVRIGGELWKAQAHDPEHSFAAGDLITVVHIQGNSLIVKEQINV